MVRLRKLLTISGALLFLLGATRNGAAQWVRTNGPQVSVHVSRNVIVLGTSGTNILSATGDDSLFISADNGATWRALTTPWNSRVMFFAMSGNELFVITAGGIFFSSDNGTNWTSTTNGPPTNEIYSFAASGGNSFAGTINGVVYHSSDNGLNWATEDAGIPNSTVTALATIGTKVLAGTQYGGVFSSTDTGMTWNPSGTGLTGVGASAFGVNGPSVFAETDQGVFLSTDSGASWAPANTGLPGNAIFEFAASETNEFAATLNAGLFLTTNNGTSWAEVNNGLPNANIRSLVANGTRLFTAMSNGNIYLFTTNGSAWSPVEMGYDTTAYAPVQVLLTSGGNLLTGAFNVGYGVFLSTNDGDSWRPDGLDSNSIFAIAEIGENLFVGVDAGLFLSTNNGSVWTSLNAGFPLQYGETYTPEVVGFATKGSDLFAATSATDGRGGVFLTTNNGSEWTQVLPSEWAETIEETSAGLLVDASTNKLGEGVFLSTDDGTNWTLANTGLPSTINAFASIGPTLFAGTPSNGVYFSSNGGASWLPVAPNSTPSDVESLLAVGTNLFAGTQSGVYFSTNSGANWSAGNSGLIANIPALASQNGYLFAGTNSAGVWRRLISEMLSPAGISRPRSQVCSIIAYPNPFESSIRINSEAAKSGPAQIVIVNALGTQVAQLFSGTTEAGERSFIWDAHAFPPGTYWCEFRKGSQISRTAITLER